MGQEFTEDQLARLDPTADAFQLTGRSGAFYGILAKDMSSPLYHLVHRRSIVMSIAADRANLRYELTTAGGQPIAVAAPREHRFAVQVKSGFDPLLVLACLLTTL